MTVRTLHYDASFGVVLMAPGVKACHSLQQGFTVADSPRYSIFDQQYKTMNVLKKNILQVHMHKKKILAQDKRRAKKTFMHAQ